jgi:hypothetical protein
VQTGQYAVAVRVTDNGGATARARAFISVIAAEPVLASGVDADGDGIDDDVDGFGDDDGDGIPNYLDAYEQPTDGYLIQNQAGDFDLNGVLRNVRLIQTEPGLRIRKGPVAIYGNVSGILVSESHVMDYAGGNNVPVSSADDNMSNIGGLYDFEIYNMLPGTTARVVLPLSARILEGATYRKFSLRNGWRDFSTAGDNAIASTRAIRGVCPAPGHASYRGGLNAFDNCVQLTLVDGGPNDADGATDGVIRDPGGVAIIDPAPGPEQQEPEDGGGGGLLHPCWLLLLMLWSALRTRGLRKNDVNI